MMFVLIMSLVIRFIIPTMSKWLKNHSRELCFFLIWRETNLKWHWKVHELFNEPNKQLRSMKDKFRITDCNFLPIPLNREIHSTAFYFECTYNVPIYNTQI